MYVFILIFSIFLFADNSFSLASNLTIIEDSSKSKVSINYVKLKEELQLQEKLKVKAFLPNEIKDLLQNPLYENEDIKYKLLYYFKERIKKGLIDLSAFDGIILKKLTLENWIFNNHTEYQDTFASLCVYKAKLSNTWYIPDEVKKYIINKAQEGNDDAQYNLGIMYANGLGVNKDEAEAVKWYTLAARQNNANAHFILAGRFMNGRGVNKDEVEAVKRYTFAAELGNASAQFTLGIKYANGFGVIKNKAKEIKWYTLAAEQGHVDAQFNLGLMYANEPEGIKNEAEAVKWYTLAAEQDDTDAQLNLGFMYAHGLGVIKDEVKGLQWIKLASDLGNHLAHFSLVKMYFKGEKVSKNFDQTMRLLLISADKEKTCQKFIKQHFIANKSFAHIKNYKTKNLHSQIRSVSYNDNIKNSTSPRATLIFAEGQVSNISRRKALQIASRDQDGLAVRSQQSGNHPITEIEGIFFKSSSKAYPLRPAHELAAYYFHTLLVGRGIPPSSLIIIKDNGNESNPENPSASTYFIQASLTVKGESFKKFIQAWMKDECSFEDLSQDDISRLVVCSYLLWPLDAKPSNFIVQEDHTTKAGLISVDNEHILLPIFSKSPSSDKKSDLNINMRNIFYLLKPVLQNEVSSSVKRFIESWPIDTFILEWMASLWKANFDYAKLCEVGNIQQELFEEQNLPFKISETSILSIKSGLKRLYFWLSSNPTHEDLFRIMLPLVHQYYTIYLPNVENPIGALKELYSYPPSLDNVLNNFIVLRDGRTVKFAMKQEQEKLNTDLSSEELTIEEITAKTFSNRSSLLNRLIKEKSSLRAIKLLLQSNYSQNMQHLDLILKLAYYSLPLIENSKPYSNLEDKKLSFYIKTSYDPPFKDFYIDINLLKKIEIKKGKQEEDDNFLGYKINVQNESELWGYETDAFWLRKEPIIAAFDQAASKFTLDLFGYGALRNLLITIDEVPYFLIEKPSKKYIHFGKALEENPNIIHKIRGDSLSSMVVSALLLNPLKDSPNNFLLEKDENDDDSESYNLIRANNELMFSPTTSNIGEILVHSILFHFNHVMNASVHPKVLNKILPFNLNEENVKNSITNLLKRWVSDIEVINKQHKKIFPEENQAELEARNYFSDDLLGRLTDRIIRFYAILLKYSYIKDGYYHTDLTHRKLMKKLKPALATIFYSSPSSRTLPSLNFDLELRKYDLKNINTNEKATKLLESLKVLNQCNIEEDFVILLDDTQNDPLHYRIGSSTLTEEKVNKLIEQVKIYWSFPQTIIREVEKGSKEALDRLFEFTEIVRAKLMTRINFKNTTSSFQRDTINKLKAAPKRSIILKNLDELSSEDFNPKNISLENIIHFELEGCSKIDQKLFQYLKEDNTKFLEKLILKRLSSLKFIDLRIYGGFSFISSDKIIKLPLLQLKEINIEECQSLKEIGPLYVPMLQKLKFKDCKNLTKICYEEEVPKLTYLSVSLSQPSQDYCIEFVDKTNKKNFLLKIDEYKQPYEQLVGYYKAFMDNTPPTDIKIKKSESLQNNNANILFENYLSLIQPNYSQNITALKLENCQITDTIVENLMYAIASNQAIKKISFKNNLISDRGAVSIARIFYPESENILRKPNTTINELDLNGNPIGNEGSEALLKSLEYSISKINQLIHLSLWSPFIEPEVLDKINLIVARRVVQTLSTNNNEIIEKTTLSYPVKTFIKEFYKKEENLIECNLMDAFLGPSDYGALEALFTTKSNQGCLHSLNLGSNYINGESVEWLSNIFISQPNLKQVNLYDNDFRGIKGSKIIKSLKSLSSLEELNLSGTGIAGDSLNDLVNVLQKSPNVKVLRLLDNKLTNSDLKYLCKLISKNPLLRELDLRWNKFSDENNSIVSSLHDSILTNDNFIFLLLDGNNITDETDKYIANQFIRRLVKHAFQNGDKNLLENLYRYGVKNDVYEEICKLILNKEDSISIVSINFDYPDLITVCQTLESSNLSLKEVDLSYNDIPDKDITILVDSLKRLNHSAKIETLNLAGNKIGFEGAEAMADLLNSNVRILQLVLSYNTIPIDGLVILSRALEKNTYLVGLNLEGNTLEEVEVDTPTLLYYNKPLVSLELPEGIKGLELAQNMSQYLERNLIFEELRQKRSTLKQINKAREVITILLSQEVNNKKITQQQIGMLVNHTRSYISKIKNKHNTGESFWKIIHEKSLEEIQKTLFPNNKEQFIDLLIPNNILRSNVLRKNYELIKDEPLFIVFLYQNGLLNNEGARNSIDDIVNINEMFTEILDNVLDSNDVEHLKNLPFLSFVSKKWEEQVSSYLAEHARNLGSKFESLGCPKEALHYYRCSADKGNIHAALDVLKLYLKLGQSKEFLKFLKNLTINNSTMGGIFEPFRKHVNENIGTLIIEFIREKESTSKKLLEKDDSLQKKHLNDVQEILVWSLYRIEKLIPDKEERQKFINKLVDIKFIDLPTLDALNKKLDLICESLEQNGNINAIILRSRYIAQNNGYDKAIQFLIKERINKLNNKKIDQQENVLIQARLGSYFLKLYKSIPQKEDNNLQRAAEFLKKAADKGHIYSKVKLANLLSLLPEKQTGKICDLLKEAAKAGNSRAKYLLGTAYKTGKLGKYNIEINKGEGEKLLIGAKDEGNAWALFQLGKLALDAEDYDEAIKYFSQGVESPSCLDSLGYIYTKHRKDFKKAEECFEKASNLDSVNYSVWRNWGILKIKQLEAKKFNYQKKILEDDAEKYMQKAVGLSKSLSIYKQAACLDSLGYIYSNYKNRFTKAEECFEKASKLDPVNYSVWRNWGWLKLNRIRNFDYDWAPASQEKLILLREAEEYTQKAIQLAPSEEKKKKIANNLAENQGLKMH
jgi:TPR repeat protein/Ran GTPase-activating protein (RanGAP) involved in mRNA processing and transport